MNNDETAALVAYMTTLGKEDIVLYEDEKGRRHIFSLYEIDLKKSDYNYCHLTVSDLRSMARDASSLTSKISKS